MSSFDEAKVEQAVRNDPNHYPDAGASAAEVRGYQARQQDQAAMNDVMSGKHYTPSGSSGTSGSGSYGGGGGEISGIGGALMLGVGAVGVACIFSENARYVVGKSILGVASVLDVVLPPIISVVGYAASAAGTGLYYTAYYGYETVATAINNIDLLAAGGAAAVASVVTATLIDENTNLFGKTRNVVGAFAVAGLAITSAVYATGTQARKLGYEIGFPHFTETGAAISGWGRPYRDRSFAPTPRKTSSYQAPIVTPRYVAPELPPHRTEEELRSLLSRIRSGYELTREQIGQLNNEGVYLRGTGRNTQIVLAPGYLPSTPAPQSRGSAQQRWERQNRRAP